MWDVKRLRNEEVRGGFDIQTLHCDNHLYNWRKSRKSSLWLALSSGRRLGPQYLSCKSRVIMKTKHEIMLLGFYWMHSSSIPLWNRGALFRARYLRLNTVFRVSCEHLYLSGECYSFIHLYLCVYLANSLPISMLHLSLHCWIIFVYTSFICMYRWIFLGRVYTSDFIHVCNTFIPPAVIKFLSLITQWNRKIDFPSLDQVFLGRVM